MPQNIVLTKDVLLSLFSPVGAYQLAYSLVLGMNLWHTFIAGIVSVKTLPRQQFGTLQAKLFPIYFSLSAGVSSYLLAVWVFNHPDIVPDITNYQNGNVVQAWTLAIVTLMQGVNMLYVGPKATKIMYERHKLERAEKKSYTDPGVSDKMKALTKSFSTLHGISSLNNLTAIIGMVFHGLWIAKYGTLGH